MAAVTIINGKTYAELAHDQAQREWVQKDIDLTDATLLEVQTSIAYCEAAFVTVQVNAVAVPATSVIATPNTTDPSKVDVTAVGATGTTTVSLEVHGKGGK